MKRSIGIIFSRFLHVRILVLGLFALIAVNLLVVNSAQAQASYYYGYNNWYDVEKSPTDPNDDYLCWAAAASNALAYGGWTVPSQNLRNQQQIFNYFEQHWTDKGSWPKYGWEWYMNGKIPPNYGPGWTQLKQNGGNFFPSDSFSNYFYTYGFGGNDDKGKLMQVIDGYLQSSFGVTIGITSPVGAHALNVWGYDAKNILVYPPNVYDKVYLDLVVTDSNDGVNALQTYTVEYDTCPQCTGSKSWWTFTDGPYKNWVIDNVEALDINPILTFQPSYHPVLHLTDIHTLQPLIINNSDPDILPLYVLDPAPVPEPTTMLLLGFGLIGLAGVRRRFRK